MDWWYLRFAFTGHFRTNGLHVTAGLIVLAVLFVLGKKNELTSERSRVLSAVGIYWHFVDVVWILVFSVIYLGFLQ